MLRKKAITALAALAVALTGVAMGPSATAATPKVLNWGSSADVTSAWDPYAMSDGHYRPIMALAYESLLKVRTDGRTFDPGLATKWAWKGNKAFVLTLRSGVKFSDGAVFDAAAVKTNLDRVVVNKYAGFRSGSLNNVSDVAVVNPSTVQINLKQPDSLLPLWLALNMGYMVSPKAIETADKTGNLTGLLTATAGTGPYILDWTKSVKGSTYNFKRNPGYWQKGAALTKAFPFDEINLKYYSNDTARANALRSGEVDVAYIGAFDVQAVDQAGFSVITENLDVISLRLSDRNGVNVKALGDIRVRQALNYAINRDQFGAFGIGTSQSFRKDLSAYNAKWDNYYKYDPAKAKSLLAAAGASNLTLNVVSISGSPLFSAITQIVQSDLKAVGVTLNIANVGFQSYFSSIGDPKYQGFFFPYGAASVPSVVNDIFGPGKVRLNPLGQSDDKLMALNDKYLAATTPAAEKAAGQAIGKYVVENALEVPLARLTYYVAYDAKKVKGVKFTSGNVMPSYFGVAPVK